MRNICSAKKQKGVVLVLFTIAMIAILAMGGLALDVSHAYVDKTRLQNALDSAALSGAMTLNQFGNDGNAMTMATVDALATFDSDLETELENANLSPTVEFSATLAGPYSANPATASFIRVKLIGDNRYDMSTWLTRVIGKDIIQVGASAVAGTIPIAPCDLGPFVVCGKTQDAEGNALNCDDPDNCYGYKVAEEGETPQECYLKAAAPGGDDPEDQIAGTQCGTEGGTTGEGGEQIGAGNFHLTEYEECSSAGSGGAQCLREALAAGARQCPGDYVKTMPGNKIGPLRQAFNTIFGYPPGGGLNADDYPSDTVTSTVSNWDPGNVLFNEEYRHRIVSGPIDNMNGVPYRREKPVVIADCTGADNTGKSELKVLEIGCFFFTRPLGTPGDGGEGNAQVVWGQFVGACPSPGEIVLDSTIFDQKKIVLYKDPDSSDS